MADEVKTAPIDEEAVRRATEKLRKFKEGKARLEEKIRSNEQFWKLRQWGNAPVHATTNLWTDIQGRYSDAMDSYPTCNIMPRQKDDVKEAETLSSVLPVIIEQNRYEETYSDVAWYTLKQGGSVQGVFWDSSKHNGLGDISIQLIDVLNFFWEPGIKDIQKSSDVFVTELIDNDALERLYPQTAGRLGQKNIAVATYMYDDTIDTSDKSVVVDWYYKKRINGKTTLQYVKFVNDIVLYASENEPIADRGYYDHGKYPFVVMSLYPIEGSLIGYGVTDIGKSTQTGIDILNSAMLENAGDGISPRYFSRVGAAINEDEYLDRKKKIVHVEGSLDEANIRLIDTKPLEGPYITLMQMKVDELKAATSNQDVHSGSTTSGVTAASAIAALQEAAGKNARSTNKVFYRAYREVIYQVIDLVRQFYTQPRMFRIAPDGMGSEEFVMFDNSGLMAQQQVVGGIDMGLRLPEFDIEVTAEKANPYKKMEANELALNFYAQGFFNPEMAEQALACLDLMDFDHKEMVSDKIRENQTMQKRLLQFEQLALQLAQQVNPALAEQISAIILKDGGQPMPAGEPITLDTGELSNPIVDKARATAMESTQI